jgi:hypothetical protein
VKLVLTRAETNESAFSTTCRDLKKRHTPDNRAIGIGSWPAATRTRAAG